MTVPVPANPSKQDIDRVAAVPPTVTEALAALAQQGRDRMPRRFWLGALAWSAYLPAQRAITHSKVRARARD